MKKKIFAKLMAYAIAACTIISAVPATCLNVYAEENNDSEFGGAGDGWDDEITANEGNDNEEKDYLDSNMRLSWSNAYLGEQQDYQAAMFTNYGTQTHTFSISCTYWNLWDIQIPNQTTIAPNETITIYVRPNFAAAGWKAGDFADAITMNAFDSDGCTISAYADVNLYISVTDKATPWVSYVDVCPGYVNLSQGQTYTFDSDVCCGDGADDSVTWSIKGNNSSSTSINGNGTLTIGQNETASNIYVTATSKQDSSVKGTAQVDISKNQFTIGTQSSPNEGGVTSGGGCYNSGDQCTVTASANNGYSFDGWYNSSNNKVSSDSNYSFSVNGSQTLTARFTRNAVWVKVKKNIDKGGTVSDNQKVDYGGNCTVTANANSGYTFIGWYDGNDLLSSSSSYKIKGLTSDKTVTAVFVQSQYTVALTANPQAGGSVSGGGTFNKGVTVTLVAKAADGYNFIAWVCNNETYSTDSTCTIKDLDRDYSVTALFQKKNAKTYTVGTSTDTGHGTVAPAGNISVPEGKTLVVSISPEGNYQVSDVKVDGKSVGAVTSYTFYNMANNHTLVASFKAIQSSTSTSKTTGASTTASTTTQSKNTGASNVTGAGQKKEITTGDSTSEATAVEDGTEITDLTGTLQDLNLTEDEARGYIENNDDRQLMETALYRGDLEVTVCNNYADTPNETCSTSYYDLVSVPNFEDVMDSILTTDEKMALFKGTKVRANLSVEGEDSQDITDSEKTEFDQQTQANGISLDSYFDVHLIKEVDGVPQLVTTLTEPIEIVMNVPESMKSDSAQYCVMRYHDGDFDILPNESTDANKIIFHTDKMSTFALGYYNSSNTAVSEEQTLTQTTDISSNTAGLTETGNKNNNAVIYIMLGVIIVGVVVIVVLALTSGRKRHRKHRK